MVRSSLTLLLIAVVFSGCHEIYTQFCQKKVPITCIKIESLDSELEAKLKDSFREFNISKECKFKLKAHYHNVSSCKNPVANSLGADFDGYLNMQILNSKGCYFRVQQDYKGHSWRANYDDVVSRLKKELEID
ncbi:MAG: hypothetical protein U9N42_03035 [Campylobacterota bacterium]|nr:hypothetical protein [Campylobacterota bacterium]